MADPSGGSQVISATALLPLAEAAAIADTLPSVYADTVVVTVEVLQATRVRSMRDPNGAVKSFLGLRWLDPNLPAIEVGPAGRRSLSCFAIFAVDSAKAFESSHPRYNALHVSAFPLPDRPCLAARPSVQVEPVSLAPAQRGDPAARLRIPTAGLYQGGTPRRQSCCLGVRQGAGWFGLPLCRAAVLRRVGDAACALRPQSGRRLRVRLSRPPPVLHARRHIHREVGSPRAHRCRCQGLHSPDRRVPAHSCTA